MKSFKSTIWGGGKNATTGAGYGIRIPKRFRDLYFEKDWCYVYVELDDSGCHGCHGSHVFNITASFWANCSEIRDVKVGKWLIDNKRAQWEHGKPPRIKVEVIGGREGREFKVSLLDGHE